MAANNIATKDRLLDAAEHLFAARGYDEVSVRDLATAADVNVAAVNYHFQGKDNLYREVILRRFAAQRDRTLAALEDLQKEIGGRPGIAPTVEVLVGEFVRSALDDPTSPGFLALMIREMHHHSPQTNATFFRELVAPVYHVYAEALMRACPDLEAEQVSWFMASIVGQVHHFVLRRLKWDALPEDSEARAHMARAFPVLTRPVDEYVTEVIRHVTLFSVAAIEGLQKKDAP